MTDQPVTPDREALIEATAMALHQACVAHWGRLEAINERYRIEITRHGVDAHDGSAALAVDALLPLLTEALDRARQQGRDEGREEAAQVIEAHRDRPLDGWAEKAYAFLSFPGGGRNEVQDALTVAARLARGPNRKDEE